MKRFTAVLVVLAALVVTAIAQAAPVATQCRLASESIFAFAAQGISCDDAWTYVEGYSQGNGNYNTDEVVIQGSEQDVVSLDAFGGRMNYVAVRRVGPVHQGIRKYNATQQQMMPTMWAEYKVTTGGRFWISAWVRPGTLSVKKQNSITTRQAIHNWKTGSGVWIPVSHGVNAVGPRVHCSVHGCHASGPKVHVGVPHPYVPHPHVHVGGVHFHIGHWF